LIENSLNYLVNDGYIDPLSCEIKQARESLTHLDPHSLLTGANPVGFLKFRLEKREKAHWVGKPG